MYVDNKLWIKGHASREIDVYYCIEGLMDSTKKGLFLLVCPSTSDPDKKNVLWISTTISYCIRDTLLNSVKIGDRRSNIYSLSIPNAKLTKSEKTFGENRNSVSSYFFLARPYNYFDDGEDESFDELFSTLNYSQWVEPADQQCLQALVKEEAMNDYVTASQCGYEFLMITASVSTGRKKNHQAVVSKNACHHCSYFIPEVLISWPIDWKHPFDTTIEYTIKKVRNERTKKCVLCLFSKYLMRDKRYRDVVRISPPFCYLLANN